MGSQKLQVEKKYEDADLINVPPRPAPTDASGRQGQAIGEIINLKGVAIANGFVDPVSLQFHLRKYLHELKLIDWTVQLGPFLTVGEKYLGIDKKLSIHRFFSFRKAHFLKEKKKVEPKYFEIGTFH